MAIHEIGHALGMGHSQITTADMYAYYNAMKQILTTDDSSGIQTIYGTPQYDQFNSNGNSNGTYTQPTNINSYIDANGQIAIPSLDITTSGPRPNGSTSRCRRSTTGTMVATVQSSNLSSLSPKVTCYTHSLGSGRHGGFHQFRRYGHRVGPRCSGRPELLRPGLPVIPAGRSFGGFGLRSQFRQPVPAADPPPNTVVLQQPDQGGGGINKNVPVVIIGNLISFGEAYTVSPPTVVPMAIGSTTAQAVVSIPIFPRGRLSSITVVLRGRCRRLARVF